MKEKTPQPRILVIDVDRGHVHEMVRNLEQNGFRAVACFSPKSALRKIRRERPDAVIVEVIMPERSGFEIAARMEADQNLSRTPVLFTTDIQNSGGGNHDYFPRPLDIDALIRALKVKLAAKL